jgi:hypothetical protein
MAHGYIGWVLCLMRVGAKKIATGFWNGEQGGFALGLALAVYPV